MMRRVNAWAAAMALLALAGCQTVPPRTIDGLAPVMPGEGEMMTLNDLYVVIDASGSMYPPEKLREAKEVFANFVKAAPDKYFDANLTVFGGEWEMDWIKAPMQPFDRAHFASLADSVKFIAGGTPLSVALADLQPSIAARPLSAAVLILSDGMSDPAGSVAAAKALAAAARGPLCFHTVHFGSEAEGRAVLDEIAAINGCGSSRHADEVDGPIGIEALERDVFFGPWMDGDGDGVPDPIDLCPDTPMGTPVNGYGCHTWGTVYFDTDKSDVKRAYGALLDEVAAKLRANPRMCLRVEGHTDSRAPDEYNQKLSERRAKAVGAALVERGAAEGQLIVEGFSEFRPAQPNTDWQNMQLNRRVELRPLP
ncbi:MAG: OmpA family protein [Candidatus Hydrogenedens sp.]|nr:OmpA family protein [Candidatus Hydrogenedens sp.]